MVCNFRICMLLISCTLICLCEQSNLQNDKNIPSAGGGSTEKQDDGIDANIVNGQKVGMSSKPVTEQNQTPDPVVLYQRLFRQKRAAQLQAVKTMQAIEKYEKQYKMVSILLEKIFTVMSEARVKLMEAGFTPGDPFPANETVREAFSIIVENTAFFGDILLRLPDMTHRILKKQAEWKIAAGWGVTFCNETKIYESSENKLLNLVAQEMKLVEPDPNYINPYREEEKLLEQLRKEQGNQESNKKTKKRKKKKKNKGPRLTIHGEL